MFSYSSKCRLLLLSLLSATTFAQDDNPCQSFGVDFQDGGSYFQNSLSNASFTFVSKYEGSSNERILLFSELMISIGCETDTCFNILVDDQGDQYQCSDTTLTPDDSPMLSTWSVALYMLNRSPMLTS